MVEIIISSWDGLATEDLVFAIGIPISILFALYAMSLVNQKIRLLENEMQSVRKDQSVISEELEMLARLRGGEEQVRTRRPK